jgi:ATP-dependent helicase HrpA
VPLANLNQLPDAAVDWLVPGLIREKVAAVMKSLPKRVRTLVVPVPEHVTTFLLKEPAGERPVREAVLAYVSKLAGERLASDVWSKDDLPPHLEMNIRVIDDAKRELAMGRSLPELRKSLGQAAQLTIANTQSGLERSGINAWDFGELPEKIAVKRGTQTITAYPALVDEGEGCAIQLFDTPEKAEAAMRGGVKRLLSFELREQLKQLDRGLPGFNQLALKLQAVVSPDQLRADMLAAITDRAFIADDALPRKPKEFEEQKKRARTRLPAVADGLVRHAQAIADANHELMAKIAASGALGRVTQEAKAQRDRLLARGFLSNTPWAQLGHLPRYLRGYALRLEKYRQNPERDGKHSGTVAGLWNQHEARAEADRAAERHDPKLEEFRWLIEELRVSLFAQELKTPFPVSVKRLQKFREDNLR